MHDILTERYLQVDAPDTRPVNLPELFRLLARDEVDDYPNLPAHQWHYWHAFLCQLAATALARQGRTELPTTMGAPEWKQTLTALTKQDWPQDQPWHLIQRDTKMPALLQPPCTLEPHPDNFKHRWESPEDLDLPYTAKNHDMKQHAGYLASLDQWLFSLVTLQTAGGFSGAGHYHVSRMNGGAASRSALSLTPSLRPGAHFRRDVDIMLKHDPELGPDEANPYTRNGHSLLWLLPWDGDQDPRRKEALELDQLSPWYIEIARRVRVDEEEGRLFVRYGTSKRSRINAAERRGVVGDPWMPLNMSNPKEPKSLTLAGGGMTARRMIDYLCSENWQPSLLLRATAGELAEEQEMLAVARGIVRGQGKTEGYHERVETLQPTTLQAISEGVEGEERTRLLALNESRRQELSQVGNILSHALHQTRNTEPSTGEAGGEGGGGRGNPSQAVQKIQEARRRVEESLDPRWLEALQEEFCAPEEQRKEIRRRWREEELVAAAERELYLDLPALDRSAARRMQSRSMAQTIWEDRIRAYQRNALSEPKDEAEMEDTAALEETEPTEEATELTQAQQDQEAMKQASQETAAGSSYTTSRRPGTGRIRPVTEADHAVALAGDLLLHSFSSVELHQLRRMNPEQPESPVFRSLLERRGLDHPDADRPDPDHAEKWACILKGLALMTPKAGKVAQNTDQGFKPSAHHPFTPAGRALCLGGDPGRRRPYCAPQRVERMLQASGPQLRQQTVRLAGMLARANQPCSWRDLATLVLTDGRTDQESQAAGEEIRTRIARDYHQARHRAMNAPAAEGSQAA